MYKFIDGRIHRLKGSKTGCRELRSPSSISTMTFEVNKPTFLYEADGAESPYHFSGHCLA